MTQKRIGGSWAPPLSDKQLGEYKKLATATATTNRPVSDYMLQLVELLVLFRKTPESKLPGTKHPIGGRIIPLEPEEVERIWHACPYPKDCDVIGDVFDALPTGTETNAAGETILVDPEAKRLRDAANHLLWFGRELAADREPFTADKLDVQLG